MILEKLKNILSEQFNVEEETITPETDLRNDLEADSLDMADLLTSIESEFEIEIQDESIENIKTVENIVNYIDTYKKN